MQNKPANLSCFVIRLKTVSDASGDAEVDPLWILPLIYSMTAHLTPYLRHVNTFAKPNVVKLPRRVLLVGPDAGREARSKGEITSA